MSTRGVIARLVPSEDGIKFVGRFHHWDSYPDGLGQSLWAAYRHPFFNRDLQAMLAYLIDQHPAGWSTINGATLGMPAGYDVAQYEAPDGRPDFSKPIPHGPQCHCHGSDLTRVDGELIVSHENASDIGCEWAYVFEQKDGHRHHARPALYARQLGNDRHVWPW